MRYLKWAKPTRMITDIYKTGWIDDNTFATPSFVTQKEESDSIFSFVGNSDYGFAKQGTLEEWKQEICTLCEGNSILTLVLCVGLSGILLRRLGLSTTVVNLIGRSSIGKTTALRVAASLWRNPEKFIQQWRSTSNALESVAENHNDCLLILDELGQIQDKNAGNIVYMLGNSKGKSRLNADSELKKSKEWMLSILSSGEIGISDKISEGGGKAKAGQLVRCIDIDCLMSEELGIFDTLPGDIPTSAEFSKILKERASKYYGIAAEEFITRLIKSTVNHLEELSKIRKIFIQEMKLENADGQVLRVADAFVLFVLTGVMACDADVFTHKRDELAKLILGAFKRWLEDRGSVKPMEDTEIVEDVFGFFDQNNARFDNVYIDENGNVKSRENAKNYNNALGIRVMHPEGGETYYIYTKAFKDEVCRGMNPKQVRKVLANKKMLLCYSDGKDMMCPYTSTRKRMVTIRRKSEVE